MERYAWVALGGGLGALLRYLLGAWLQGLLGVSFPWNTLLINALGSFLVGLVVQLSLLGALSPEARLFWAMGVLGGFTTFSTFSYELVAMAQAGAWERALAYGVLSLLLGPAMALLGLRLGALLGG